MRKMTELQWLKEGYIKKEGAVGSEEWNNNYYRFKVMRYTEDEVEKSDKASELWKAHQREVRKNRKEIENYEKKLAKAKKEKGKKKIEELSKYHTAYQWLKKGKVPIDANWILGEILNGEYYILGSSYYYCHEKYVIDDPERAKVLVNSFPVDCNYNGMPWW